MAEENQNVEEFDLSNLPKKEGPITPLYRYAYARRSSMYENGNHICGNFYHIRDYACQWQASGCINRHDIVSSRQLGACPDGDPIIEVVYRD